MEAGEICVGPEGSYIYIGGIPCKKMVEPYIHVETKDGEASILSHMSATALWLGSLEKIGGEAIPPFFNKEGKGFLCCPMIQIRPWRGDPW